MKTNKILLCVALLLATLSSCRQENDFVASFGSNDKLAFSDAEKSFSAQFDALWQAVNNNYAAWQIETVDWDETYTKFRPRFVEFDTLVAHGTSISDEQLAALYHEVLDTLHDGHSQYYIKNLCTKNELYIVPQKERNKRRFGEDYEQIVPNFSLEYYTSDEIPEAERFGALATVNVSCSEEIGANLEMGAEILKAAYDAATAEEEREELQSQMQMFKEFSQAWSTGKLSTDEEVIAAYNALAASCHDARMPQYMSHMPENSAITIVSGITNDGIAYLHFNKFFITSYLKTTDQTMEDYSDKEKQMVQAVKDAWQLWFDAIQILHTSGQLKGVIIDLRQNIGGMNEDQQYVLGALLPSGGYKAGTYTTKNGTGRLDNSVDFDFIYKTYEKDHAVINDVPVVALCDHGSVSNAEITSIIVKQMPNGYVIGSQTHGGMSCISPDPAYYSMTYSGTFGEQGKTPIYGIQTLCLNNWTGFGPLEGVGVTPDQCLEFDMNLAMTEQRDNQLEAALKYIRNK